MKLGIMQPYFLPYIGYWQLINAVDVFVIYDNIQYTKKGWINRNRVLNNGKDVYITIPIEKDSDFLNVDERIISESFDKKKILNQIKEYYKKAPNFPNGIKIFEEILVFEERNLFEYIFNSIKVICNKLEINTQIIISSEIEIDHKLKGKDKVISICKALNANEYINPIGGTDLYSKESFSNNGIQLEFLESTILPYEQFNCEFIPYLSIIDILMFNSQVTVKRMLENYRLL